MINALRVGIVVGLLAGVARADVPPPGAASCVGASAGTACKLCKGGTGESKSGTCAASTCKSCKPDGDGGVKCSDSACVLCSVAGDTNKEFTDCATTPSEGSCAMGHGELGVWALLFAIPVALMMRRRPD